MRILNGPKPSTWAPGESFFVALWYELTHPLSLDSYRVRCMNIRTVMIELAQEIRAGRISDLEISCLLAEAKEFLSEDGLVAKEYPENFRYLGGFLDEQRDTFKNFANSSSKDREQRSLQERATLLHVAEDFGTELNFKPCYRARLCAALPIAIQNNEQGQIAKLLGALLSDLLHEGWTLDGLHQWHKTFLRKGGVSFSKSLTFLLEGLQREPQFFRVLLRVHGSTKLASPAIQESVGISLSKKAPTIFTQTEQALTKRQRDFLREQELVTFVEESDVQAVDVAGAALAARGMFEPVLDLVRFDYERSRLRIGSEALVRRQDGKLYIAPTHQTPPNPASHSEISHLTRLSGELERVLGRREIAAESKEQVRAALRQYRFGKDSENVRDKFLYWWLGLEALSRLDNKGGIGESVKRNVSRALLHGYLPRLIQDLLETLLYLRVDWPSELATRSGASSLADLDCAALFRILANEDLRRQLWQLVAPDSLIVWRWPPLAEMLSSPKDTQARFERHQLHLEWQLQRLYRIRCCIVHGSPIHFPLEPFTANLEFYLKQLIVFVIESFSAYPHIQTLESLFARSQERWERQISTLASAGKTHSHAPAAAVHKVLFSDLIRREAACTY